MNTRTVVGLASLTGLLAGCVRFRAKDINFYPASAPEDLNGQDRADWDEVERRMNALFLLRQGMLNRYNSLSALEDKTRDCIRPRLRQVNEIFRELINDRWRFQNATRKGDEPTRENNLIRIRTGSSDIGKLGTEANRCGPSEATSTTESGVGFGPIAGIASTLLLLGILALLRRGHH